MLKLENVGFAYETKKHAYVVFRDVSVEVNDSEFFCIIGPSGCGKSTLLKIIAGFESPSNGRILEDEALVEGVSYERAMVFQEDAVFPWLSVYQNVEYGLKVRGVGLEERQERVRQFLRVVGLEGFEQSYPRQLSGGMRKRVDLARVLANDPRILLMDEPFGALDAITKEKLQVQLTSIWEATKKTVIFITHDVEEALFLGTRVAVMRHIDQGGGFKVFDVPFARPRDLTLKNEQGFQQMRRQLLAELG